MVSLRTLNTTANLLHKRIMVWTRRYFAEQKATKRNQRYKEQHIRKVILFSHLIIKLDLIFNVLMQIFIS